MIACGLTSLCDRAVPPTGRGIIIAFGALALWISLWSQNAAACGSCNPTWSGSSAAAIINCDSTDNQCNPQQAFTMQDRWDVSGTFQDASCLPTGYDSTFVHLNCVTSVVGSNVSSTETYRGITQDCNWHNALIKTTIMCNLQGFLQRISFTTPVAIGYQCNKTPAPNCAPCP